MRNEPKIRNDHASASGDPLDDGEGRRAVLLQRLGAGILLVVVDAVVGNCM